MSRTRGRRLDDLRISVDALVSQLAPLILGADAAGTVGTRRYQASELRGIRGASRVGLLVIVWIALSDGVVFSVLHPDDAPMLVGINLCLAATAAVLYFMLRRRLRHAPEVTAFVGGYAAYLAVLATISSDPGLALVGVAYLVIVPSIVALVVPWRTTTHVAWLSLYVATTLVYLSMDGRVFSVGMATAADYVVVMCAGALASLVGHMMLYRARVRSFAQLETIRAARRAARASERRYHTLVEQASSAIFLADQGGHYLDANVAACRLLGYTRDEILGLTIPDLWPRDANPGQEERLETMRNGGVVVSERLARRKDGTLVPTETSAGLLPDGRFHSIVRDISARKAAEAERDRLAAAIEQTTDLVIVTNPEGRIVYVNRAFTTILGWGREDVLGKFVPDVFRAVKHPPEVYAAIDAARSAGRNWSGRLTDVRRDGTYVEVDVVLSPLRGPAGELLGSIEVARDVTHEAALEAQLRQAQKMEAVGRLAGGVAHDFNNLLAAIRGYTELCHQSTEPGEQFHEYLGEVLKASDRAKLLTQRLLTFARQQPASPAVVDVNEIVAGLVPMLRQVVDERTRLTVDLASEPTFLRLDAGLLEQALLNLVINARDSITSTGVISVRTGVESVDRDHVAARSGLEPGRYALLTVQDTGRGIAPENLAHLFEPFFSTKPVNQGTGLGLSIVWSVVTAAGGLVLVESEPGNGARFDLYFPAVPAPAHLDVATGARADEALSGTEELLIVEDEDAIRAFVARILRSAGYAVRTAASAEAALLVVAGESAPRLVVTDVLLPSESGPDLAARLRERMPDLPVLFISGYDGDRVASDTRFDSGTAFLAKPFSADELLRAVRTLLDATDLLVA